uniref:GRIP domain-containing protein n=2 Tax=Stomoxys calcitrans TaxID=35570 RepID=A0A1I8PWY1_STOCA
MISSVLDFNQGETDKVGLNKQQGGWLGSLLGGGGGGSSGSHSKENLVQAFVQFLEQESQPQTQQQQMPNLLNITQHSSSQGSTTGATGATPATSRRSSNITNPALSQQSSGGNATATAHNTPVPIQPLLLTSTVLDDFSPTRNSSSILKDILSDS